MIGKQIRLERIIDRNSKKTVIIVDDGLASGYTMRAAIESIKKHNPSQVIAAVPVAPAHAVKDVQRVADRVVSCVVSNQSVFYVADYYNHWYDITDSEVLSCLKGHLLHET